MLQSNLESLNKFELGEPLGDKFRFCLPYIGKSDSRRVYRDELADLLKRASWKNGENTPQCFASSIKSWWSSDEEEFAFAAGKEKKPIHMNCAIENHEEILSMKYSPNSNTVWIYIFSSDKADYSSALDNSEIVDRDGGVLGKIQNGKCILNVKKGFDGSIALRTSDGKICFLKDLS